MNSPVEMLEFVMIQGAELGGPARDLACMLWEKVNDRADPLDFHPHDHFSNKGLAALKSLCLDDTLESYHEK